MRAMITGTAYLGSKRKGDVGADHQQRGRPPRRSRSSPPARRRSAQRWWTEAVGDDPERAVERRLDLYLLGLDLEVDLDHVQAELIARGLGDLGVVDSDSLEGRADVLDARVPLEPNRDPAARLEVEPG